MENTIYHFWTLVLVASYLTSLYPLAETANQGLRGSFPSPTAEDRMHLASHTQSENSTSKDNQIDVEWKKLWKGEWTNWMKINTSRPPSPSFVNMTFEERFLAVLHMGYRTNLDTCGDKNQVDCPVWSNLGYCEHDRPRYATWMMENCPESCGKCNEDEVDNGVACKNKRQTCDRLSSFCTGSFKSHMIEWCPKTCKICDSGDDDDGSGAAEQQSPGITHMWNGAQVKTAVHAKQEEDQICFPTTCGETPALKDFLPTPFIETRVKRSIAKENRRRRRIAMGGDRLRRALHADVQLKIVGGSWAKRGEFPWHGLILQKVGRYVRFCGITIICEKWVITAAHCLASTEFGFPETRDMINTFTVYVGRYQGMFGYTESSTQIFKRSQLKRFIIHPKFKITPNFNYDIALVELSAPIKFNSYVQPVCIPTVNANVEGDVLWTYGWGATLGYGPSAQYLKKVDLPFVKKEDCKRIVWTLPEEGVLCAGGEARKDTCTGDSGGSLVRKMDDQRYYIFGVTSYGNKHCNSRYPYSPGIYTDVSHYYEWIRNETKSCCDDKKRQVLMKSVN